MAGRRTKQLTSVTASSAALLKEAEDARAREAYELRQKGLDWWEIAEEMHLTIPAAKDAIKKGIAAAAELVSDHTRSELLALEVGRLDKLQRALWADATAGDVHAVREVRNLIADRVKLLRLDAEAASIQQNTVVVSGTSAAYVEALRAIKELDVTKDTSFEDAAG